MAAKKTDTQSVKLTRPGDLAERIGVDAKLIRSYLRKEFSRDASRKNTSWHLTPDMCDAVTAHFTPAEDTDTDEEQDAEAGVTE